MTAGVFTAAFGCVWKPWAGVDPAEQEVGQDLSGLFRAEGEAGDVAVTFPANR